jgi:hypothetical protein
MLTSQRRRFGGEDAEIGLLGDAVLLGAIHFFLLAWIIDSPPRLPDPFEAWRATLAGGSLVAGFSDGVAFLLALPALGATSGAGGPTVATGSGSFAVVSTQSSRTASM